MESTNTNLSSNYWNISHLTEILLSHCEKYQIAIWFESNLSNNLNKYTGNYGMSIYDYDRLQYTLTNDFVTILNEKSNSDKKMNDLSIDFNFYHDPNCLTIYFEGNTEDVINIIFYHEYDGQIKSLIYDSTKSLMSGRINYCYDINQFYPLVKKIMLGHIIYLPHNQEESNQSQNIDLSKHLEPVFRPILKIPDCTFAELVTHVENKKEPFIIRKTNFLSCQPDRLEQLIKTQTSNIYGYKSSITWEEQENSAQIVWKDYQENSLDFNIVDSPIDDKSILSKDWNEYAIGKLGEMYKFSLTWIFTQAPKITHFHTDPEYAGGYMKLLSGEKIWWCVLPIDYHYLVKKGHTVETLAELDFCQMIQLENNYLFGKILVDVLRDDDLIWFPIDTLHKVITTENSHGFGGYL